MVLRKIDDFLFSVINGKKNFFDQVYTKDFSSNDALAYLLENEGDSYLGEFAKNYKRLQDNEMTSEEAVGLADKGSAEFSFLVSSAIIEELLEGDIKDGISYAKAAIDSGCFMAAYELSFYYRDRDNDLARQYANLAIEHEIFDGYFTLATIEEDDEKALEYLEKGANLGSGYCNGLLGKCYWFGVNVERDYNKAIEYFSIADYLGNTAYTDLYVNALLAQERYEEARNIALENAQESDNPSMWGLVCEANYFLDYAPEDTFSLASQLLDNGVKEMHRILGFMCFDGFGTKVDYISAISHLRNAIEFYKNDENIDYTDLINNLNTLIEKAYMNMGLCRYCGGSFQGLLSKKCSNCGRKKDY